MKLTNHQSKNAYTLYDGTFIDGTLTMSQDEYAEVDKYLQKVYKKAVKTGDTYIRDSLRMRPVFIGYQRPFSIGVTASKIVIKKYFTLKRYRVSNYAIKITK